eukprot:COSAG06_NODE_4010_length_4665_cov_2.707403_1_plen_87_part_00
MAGNIGCLFGGWWYSTPSAGKKTRLFAPVVLLKNDHFAKTGSGQTYKKPQKRVSSAGECAAGEALGTDGCTWRTVSQPKTVNDTGE